MLQLDRQVYIRHWLPILSICFNKINKAVYVCKCVACICMYTPIQSIAYKEFSFEIDLWLQIKNLQQPKQNIVWW